MPKLNPDVRHAVKRLVLRESLKILAAGYPPSERRLRDAVPGRGVDLLITLRNELIAEAKIPWRPGEPTEHQASVPDGQARGLTGESAADQRRMRRVLESIRSEKARRGEIPWTRIADASIDRRARVLLPRWEDL